jgi:hypothetical protein
VSTLFFKIVSAAMAALQADPPVCNTIYRARPTAVPDTIDRAVSVQWDQASALPRAIGGAPLDWSTRLSIECFARGAGQGDTGDALVDPLLEAVYARLAADTTLGGVVDDLNIVGVEAENTVEGKKTGWVRLTYQVLHSTGNSTLE